ncbi:MAG: protein kinase [Planctomycetaceae bacterium]|nr:protein kinase [Planctomycetaceae bacterium]
MTDRGQLSHDDQRRLDAACQEFRNELSRIGRLPDFTKFTARVPETLRERLLRQLRAIADEHQSANLETRPGNDAANDPAKLEVKPRTPGPMPPESSKPASTESNSGSDSPETVIISQTPKKTDDPKVTGSKPASISVAKPDSESTISEIIPSHDALHKYVVEQEIDRGGMGVVLRVHDQRLQRTIALKVIRGQEGTGSSARKTVDAGTLQRFIREAQITGRLDHPGVVPIHELARDENDRLYFTMKYVEGHTLKHVLQEHRNGSDQWTLSRITDAMIRVCETLAFAHSREVIHRDLKPSNVMVGKFGEVYVMDWGLAKVLGEAEAEFAPSVYSQDESSSYKTMYGAAIGTPFYMPPEQAAGKLDELDCRTDVYAAGAILYEILTGQRPYWSDPPPSGMSVIRQVIDGPPKDIRELNRKAAPELVAIAQKAMNRNMADRYQSAADLAEDLRAYLSQRIVSAHRTGMVTRLKKWVSRNQGLTIASMLALLTTIGAMCVITVMEYSNRTEAEKRNAVLSNTIRDKDLAEKLAHKAQQETVGISLASHSKSLIEAGDPELATLLSIEAVQRHPAPQTRGALYAAAARVIPSTILDVPRALVITDMAWFPGGRGLVVVGNGSGYIYRIGNDQPTSQMVNRQQLLFTAACCSSDGTRVLTSGLDGTLALWDANSGTRTLEMDIGYETVPRVDANPRSKLLDVAFCLNEQSAVTVSADHKIHLIDLEAGRQLIAMEMPATGDTTSARAPLTVMKVSPNGRVLIIGDATGHVQLWDLEARRLVKSVQAIYHPVNNISFSTEGRRFVVSAEVTNGGSYSSSASTQVWSGETGEPLATFESNGLGVACAAWHPTEPVLAFGLTDGTVRLWNAETASLLSVSDPQPDSVRKICFAPDGKQLATQSGATEIVLWHLVQDNGKPRLLQKDHLTGHKSQITHLEFDETGQLLLSGCRDSARVWQISAHRPVPSFGNTTNPYRLQISPVGDCVFAADSDEAKGYLWRFSDLQPLVLEFGGMLNMAGFSRDGDHLVAMLTDGTCKVFSTETGALESTVQNSFRAWGHALSGQSLALTGELGTTLWNLATGTLIRTVSKESASSHVLAGDGTILIADPQVDNTRILTKTDLVTGATTTIENAIVRGQVLTSASGRLLSVTNELKGDSTSSFAQISVVDVEAGKVLFTTNADNAEVLYSSISRDDSRLLIAYFSHPSCAAEIYSIPDGRRLQQLGEPREEVPGFSPLLEKIVTRSPALGTRLWNVRDGKIINKLDPTPATGTVDFSSDGASCAIRYESQPGADGLGFGTVSLWETKTGTLITALPGQNAFREGSAFAADSKLFLTLSGAGCLRLWPIDIKGLNFASLNRRLTKDEKEMYGLGGAPRQVTSGSTPESAWPDLDEKIRLLIPVTTERRQSTWSLLEEVEKWLAKSDSAEEKSLALNSVDRLITGSFDTDPEVLSRIASLHQTYGNKVDAARMMEDAARHPRALSLSDKLAGFRNAIAPAVVSERAVDEMFESAELNAGRSDMLDKTMSWAEKNSPHFDSYIKARKLQLEEQFSDAVKIFESIIDDRETGPETVLHCAECLLELGQPEQAHKVLHASLTRDQVASPDVWNLWLQVGFHDLKLTPQQLLDSMPANQPRPSGDKPHRHHVVQLLTTLTASKPVRFNCGGDHYIAANGDVWMADAFYNSGFEYFGTLGDAALFSGPIRNTTDEVLYQSERYFDHTRTDLTPGYHIPLPDGEYTVMLGFAEIYQADRSYDVRVENTPVRSNYDPSRTEEDWATAQQIEIPILIEDGQFDLYFEELRGTDPKISCIQITPKPSGSVGQ